MNGWTAERRAKQSQLIQNWKPWKNAGVKTEAGKKISCMNAYKHGGRSARVKEAQKAIAQQNRYLRELKAKLS